MGSQARSPGPISSWDRGRRAPGGYGGHVLQHLTAASSQGKPLCPDRKVGAVRAAHPSPVLTPTRTSLGTAPPCCLSTWARGSGECEHGAGIRVCACETEDTWFLEGFLFLKDIIDFREARREIGTSMRKNR